MYGVTTHYANIGTLIMDSMLQLLLILSLTCMYICICRLLGYTNMEYCC